MNYKQIYDDLMLKSTGRKKGEGVYYESHHIMPRSMGGSDDISNKALLTGREHFIAHRLLTKIYPENTGLHYSVYRTTVSSSNQSRGLTSRMIELGKIANSIAAKGRTGNKNSFYGKEHTPEFIEKQIQRGRQKLKEKNPNYGNRWSWDDKGYDRTKLSLRKKPDLSKPETKEKLRIAKTGIRNPNGVRWTLKNRQTEEIRVITCGIKRFFSDYPKSTYAKFCAGKDVTWELISRVNCKDLLV